MNRDTMGQSLTLTLFGESHGPAVGCVVQGLAPGLEIDLDFMARQLQRRKGAAPLSTGRREADAPKILSGAYRGRTTGTALCLLIPIIAGLGLNFAMTLGAMAGEIALILVSDWQIWGIPGVVLAMIVSLVVGIPLGSVMGRFKHRLPDQIGTAIVILIQAVPAAVYYLYIQMYGTTALNIGLLFKADRWQYWVLPVFSMSLGNIAFYAMWLRRYMVDESNKDYVLLARAKGASENRIALRHVFRNAMVPLVQYIPSAFLNTVVGSIYIESLYSIPGMGGLLVTCVQRHDNTMVQGIVLLYACVGIIGLILGDLLMVLIDPRISLGKKEGGR